MANRHLTFQDISTIQGVTYLKDAQDFVHDIVKDQSRRVSLTLESNATYSGYLLNGRTYPGTHMRDATPTWTSHAHGGVSPYDLPVLMWHDEKSEPIGRVVKATYTALKALSELEDDWKVPAMDLERGSGFIRLGMKITDKAAIEKFLDGRYATFSTNFQAHALICSVCGKDLLATGQCEHKPGRSYEQDGDNLTCYYIAPPRAYTEVSVVNKPAQPFAVAESMKVLADSLVDSTLTSEELAKTPIRGEFDVSPQEFTVSLKDEATGDVTVLTVKDGQPDTIPSGTGAVRSSPKVTISVSSVTPSPKGTAETEVGSKADKSVMDDNDFAVANIAQGLFNANLLNDNDGAEEIISLVEKLEDAEFTPAQKKLLKSKQYCGPNHIFPVPDKAHVIAARKLITYLKGSEAEKADILAKIDRKAAKYGVTDSQPGQQTLETTIMADTAPAAGGSGGDTTKPDASVQALLDQLSELRGNVRQLQADRDTKDAEIQRLVTEVTGLKDNLHVERCNKLALMRAVTVKTVDGKALDSIAAVEEYTGSLKDRSHASVVDALKDEANAFGLKLPHLKGLPAFVTDAAQPAAPVITRVVEDAPKKTTSDNLEI